MPYTPSTATPFFSLEQHQFILERIPDPISVLTDNQIVYANAAAAAVIGARTPEEVLGKPVSAFLPPEECSRLDELEAFSNPGGSSAPETVTLMRLDGHRVTVQMKAFPIEYAGIPSTLFICKDLTAEKDYEQSLRRNEELLRRVVQLSPEAIALHANGKLYYANEVAVRMFRASSASELIGRSIYDFIHEESRSYGAKRIAETRNRSTPLAYAVHKMVRLDGEVFDAEASSVEIGEFGSEGLHCVQTVLRDVTERVARENELREHSRRFERLLKFLPEPIVISDMGRILYCNKQAAKLVRVERQEDVIGTSIFDYLHPVHHQESAEVVRTVMLTYDPTPFVERKLICADGEIITVEIASIRIDHYQGKSVTLSVLRDLTERKQAEELLIRSEKLSVIGQLAAGVAHEIRNPLTSLRGFTQLLRRDLDLNRYYYIDTMLSELDRITYIVNDFMSLSKPQLVAYRNHDIVETLRAVLSVIESEAVLHNIDIQLTDSGGLPPVRCDEHRIKQVFLNVLKNAIDAMPNGGSIAVSAEASDGELLVRIRDEGAGMPKELIEKIGDPFFTTKSDGNGLGLMICHRILEAHNGSLRFASAPGVGTTVDIRLPIAADA